jgi:hypothetical protein
MAAAYPVAANCGLELEDRIKCTPGNFANAMMAGFGIFWDSKAKQWTGFILDFLRASVRERERLA